MISAKEAEAIVLKNAALRAPVALALEEAVGRVLREDVRADRDVPAFDRVTMDGVAFNLAAWQKGCRAFVIEGTQKAGMPALTLKGAEGCIEVMTGAVLPRGCDRIVPVEDIAVKDGKALVREGVDLRERTHVHAKASDAKAGKCLMAPGRLLKAPDIAVAAAVGKSELLVSPLPKIAVVGTGDEIVPLGQPLELFQIRPSNAYALQAFFKAHGYGEAKRFHITDDAAALREQLNGILKKFDVVVLSGGVSMGKADLVPAALEALGVQVLFHKVSQRPGKPFWFGKSKNGVPVFALPGNPVSTQICARRYVLPYLAQCAGRTDLLQEWVPLKKGFEVKTSLTYFLPVRLEVSVLSPGTAAVPVPLSGSGDYLALAESDGFLELPAETLLPAGHMAALYRW